MALRYSKEDESDSRWIWLPILRRLPVLQARRRRQAVRGHIARRRGQPELPIALGTAVADVAHGDPHVGPVIGVSLALRELNPFRVCLVLRSSESVHALRSVRVESGRRRRSRSEPSSLNNEIAGFRLAPARFFYPPRETKERLARIPRTKTATTAVCEGTVRCSARRTGSGYRHPPRRCRQSRCRPPRPCTAERMNPLTAHSPEHWDQTAACGFVSLRRSDALVSSPGASRLRAERSKAAAAPRCW